MYRTELTENDNSCGAASNKPSVFASIGEGDIILGPEEVEVAINQRSRKIGILQASHTDEETMPALFAGPTQLREPIPEFDG